MFPRAFGHQDFPSTIRKAHPKAITICLTFDSAARREFRWAPKGRFALHFSPPNIRKRRPQWFCRSPLLLAEADSSVFHSRRHLGFLEWPFLARASAKKAARG